MKTPILVTVAICLALLTIFTDWTPEKPVQRAAASEKTLIQPDPYRPYYDMWGNKWSYDGILIKAACPNKPDPITHKDNPECPVPLPKITNKSVQQEFGK